MKSTSGTMATAAAPRRSAIAARQPTATTEEADDQSAMRAEPALRDRGARDLSGRARTEADHDPPDRIELPELADIDEREETRADEQDPSGEKLPRPEALEEPAAERSAQAEREQRDADRKRDRGAIPPELLLERNDDHARRRANRLRSHQGHERHGDDHPCVVEAADLHRHFESRECVAHKLARGEVSEWLMVPLSKSGRRKPRGFESRPLR